MNMCFSLRKKNIKKIYRSLFFVLFDVYIGLGIIYFGTCLDRESIDIEQGFISMVHTCIGIPSICVYIKDRIIFFCEQSFFFYFKGRSCIFDAFIFSFFPCVSALFPFFLSKYFITWRKEENIIYISYWFLYPLCKERQKNGELFFLRLLS